MSYHVDGQRTHRICPHLFEGGVTWVTYLRDTLFNRLRHGEPFLLIQRMLVESGRPVHPLIHGDHREEVRTTYYLGWLDDDGELFDEAGTIHSSRFGRWPTMSAFQAVFDPKMAKAQSSALHLPWMEIRYTPLQDPFEDPDTHDVITAFELAIGVEEIEALHFKEGKMLDKRFSKIELRKFVTWYAESIATLNIPIVFPT